MCGHGMIGVAATLAHLGKLGTGEHLIETPVGTVQVMLRSGVEATIRNVPAYRYRGGVEVDVPGFSRVAGDIAWGGNWFFLVRKHTVAQAHELTVRQVELLTSFTWEIRRALDAEGIRGANGAEIDHIELYGDAHDPKNDSRNFVLCPGKAYDRSPCGTGTSAKMACLAAEGYLKPGTVWRQEGILGTVFEGSFEFEETPGTQAMEETVGGQGPRIIPSITGSAYVTAQCTLVFDPHDPFRLGVPE